MGNVEKVDRMLRLNEMLYYVRNDPELRRRWTEDLDGLARQFGLTQEELVPRWRGGPAPGSLRGQSSSAPSA